MDFIDQTSQVILFLLFLVPKHKHIVPALILDVLHLNDVQLLPHAHRVEIFKLDIVFIHLIKSQTFSLDSYQNMVSIVQCGVGCMKRNDESRRVQIQPLLRWLFQPPDQPKDFVSIQDLLSRTDEYLSVDWDLVRAAISLSLSKNIRFDLLNPRI